NAVRKGFGRSFEQRSVFQNVAKHFRRLYLRTNFFVTARSGNDNGGVRGDAFIKSVVGRRGAGVKRDNDVRTARGKLADRAVSEPKRLETCGVRDSVAEFDDLAFCVYAGHRYLQTESVREMGVPRRGAISFARAHVHDRKPFGVLERRIPKNSVQNFHEPVYLLPFIGLLRLDIALVRYDADGFQIDGVRVDDGRFRAIVG